MRERRSCANILEVQSEGRRLAAVITDEEESKASLKRRVGKLVMDLMEMETNL